MAKSSSDTLAGGAVQSPGASFNALLETMVEGKQLSSMDAEALAQQCRNGTVPAVQTEEDVLRWLADEYDLSYTNLDEVELDRQLLSYSRPVSIEEDPSPQGATAPVEVA